MYKAVPLVKYMRSGLVEQEHCGLVILADKSGVIKHAGEDNDYPFFLRSCAKPLQASLIIDYGLDKLYNLTNEEIALCCASHAGEKVHVDIAKRLLKKTGLSEKHLKCGLHKPLSKTARQKTSRETVLHNNCIGKHIMMLALCKQNGWDVETYCEPEHPVQQAVMKKISELCEIAPAPQPCGLTSAPPPEGGGAIGYPLTKDGCGVPIMSMPLRSMLTGYLNLFLDPKYEKIKTAFLAHPYIIGGEDRLDTKIMMKNPPYPPFNKGGSNLIAKVGAGGIVIVVNLEKSQGLIIKIADACLKAREITAAALLRELSWAQIEVSCETKTLHGEVVGGISVIEAVMEKFAKSG